MEKCLLCSLNAMTTRQDNSSRTIYNCVSCGVFVVSDLAVKTIKRHVHEVCAFLQARQLSGQSNTVLISYKNAKMEKDYLLLTVDQIVDMFPKNFTQQIEMTLINLSYLSLYPGEEVRVEKLDIAPIFYLKTVNFDALSFVIKSMASAELIDVNYYGTSFFPCGITVSPKGWDLAAKLKENTQAGAAGQVLLVYSQSQAQGEALRTAAQKAARECGKKLVTSDMISDDGMLGDEIAAQIKASSFVVIDLTEAGRRFFYAWGYAKAQGKHILLICNGEKKGKLGFDPSQIGITFWKDAKQIASDIGNFIKAR